MAKLKGKEQLCKTDLKYFKSEQGVGGRTLFDRYPALSNIIVKNIEPRFQNFLAQPIRDDDSIIWFAKEWSQVPQQLSELQGEEREKYEQIKQETVSHYNSVIDTLKRSGKDTESVFISDATKFIDDQFIYCYDDIVVLGVWGMRLRDNVRETIGVAIKNAFPERIKPKQPDPESDPESEPDVTPDIEHEPNQEEVTESEAPIEPYIVRFYPGDSGFLHGISEYKKYDGDIISTNEVPSVETRTGYEFIGWDKNPYDYRVDGDTEFIAQYRELEPERIYAAAVEANDTIDNVGSPGIMRASWWEDMLNWLLLLLLLGLIFWVTWSCLLGNGCCFSCNCRDQSTIVIPDQSPTPTPVINPDQKPELDKKPAPTPSSGDIQFLLKWNNYNDLDLSCIDPSGAVISFQSPKSITGGRLEIDMNVENNRSSEPIENIFWPSGTAPNGKYDVYLTYYAKHDSVDETPYSVMIKHGEKMENFEGTIKKSDGKKLIYSFNFTK